MGKVIHGFGGCKLICGGYEVDFPLNLGTIRFNEEFYGWKTRSRKSKRQFIGWRPVILVQLQNVSTTTANNMIELIDLVNYHKQSGTLISVAPRYDYSFSTGLSYDCNLITDWDTKDVGNIASAQTLDLQFESEALIPEVPNYHSDMTIYAGVDYAGDTVIDHAGNQVIAIQ